MNRPIGRVLINDGLGTEADVLSIVEDHPYLGLNGQQKRWVISTYERTPRVPNKPVPKPVHCRINDSQIIRWIYGPDIEEPTEREQKYDWDQLLNGEIYELTANEDFTCKASTFEALARKHCKNRNLKLKIEVLDSGDIVLQGVIK